MYAVDQLPVIDDELALLASWVPLKNLNIIELGCGSARMARELLRRCPGCHVTGLEVDAVQHQKNLAAPQEGLDFLAAGAESVPLADAQFDLALMLKSLHHVPVAAMGQALAEVARVLKPGGYLYVSEPIYDGALNEIVRLFNDEGVVRAAAQAAVDEALAHTPYWEAVAQHDFVATVSWPNFDEFERRMMRPTFADHQLDAAKVAQVRAAFEFHCGPQGVRLVRPMRVRLLRRIGG